LASFTRLAFLKYGCSDSADVIRALWGRFVICGRLAIGPNVESSGAVGLTAGAGGLPTESPPRRGSSRARVPSRLFRKPIPKRRSSDDGHWLSSYAFRSQPNNSSSVSWLPASFTSRCQRLLDTCSALAIRPLWMGFALPMVTSTCCLRGCTPAKATPRIG
jgi:hypothetical protein